MSVLDEQILRWISPQSRVLDLGCGAGELLAALQQQGSRGLGVDVDPACIQQCLVQGLAIVEQDIDKGLNNFASDSFDVVIMARSLQELRFPAEALREMLRIGRECIVAFPNFAYLPHRLYLLRWGLMPVSRELPNRWHNTPNIHLFSVRDFEQLCGELGVRIQARLLTGNWLGRIWPNLWASMALYRLSRG